MSPPRYPFSPWPAPLLQGTLLRRYHRFLADVRLGSGEVVVAHCVNTGAMEGLVQKGARVWLLPSDNPARKVRFTWVISEQGGVLVGTDTSLPNRLVASLLEARALSGLKKHTGFAAEQRYGDSSRIDFLLSRGRRDELLEVKNCHLVYPDRGAYFPDSRSERGEKHLRELTHEVSAGRLASVLFVVQRPDARFVRPSDLHDPGFARAAREAARAGVRFRAIRLAVTPEGVQVERRIPVDLAPYDTRPLLAYRAALKPNSGWERPPKA